METTDYQHHQSADRNLPFWPISSASYRSTTPEMLASTPPVIRPSGLLSVATNGVDSPPLSASSNFLLPSKRQRLFRHSYSASNNFNPWEERRPNWQKRISSLYLAFKHQFKTSFSVYFIYLWKECVSGSWTGVHKRVFVTSDWLFACLLPSEIKTPFSHRLRAGLLRMTLKKIVICALQGCLTRSPAPHAPRSIAFHSDSLPSFLCLLSLAL